MSFDCETVARVVGINDIKTAPGNRLHENHPQNNYWNIYYRYWYLHSFQKIIIVNSYFPTRIGFCARARIKSKRYDYHFARISIGYPPPLDMGTAYTYNRWTILIEIKIVCYKKKKDDFWIFKPKVIIDIISGRVWYCDNNVRKMNVIWLLRFSERVK